MRCAESLVTDGMTICLIGTQGGWSETSDLHSSGAPITPLWACGATPCGGSRPSDSFLSRSEGSDDTEVYYLKDTGRTRLASAGAMARRRPEKDWRKVDAATRCSGACPHA